MRQVPYGNRDIKGIGSRRGHILPGPVKRDTGSQPSCLPYGMRRCRLGVYEDVPGSSVVVENNVKAFARGTDIRHRQKSGKPSVHQMGPVSVLPSSYRIRYDSQNSKTAEIGHYIVSRAGFLPLRQTGRFPGDPCATSRACEAGLHKGVMPGLYAFVDGDVERLKSGTWNSG